MFISQLFSHGCLNEYLFLNKIFEIYGFTDIVMLKLFV